MTFNIKSFFIASKHNNYQPNFLVGRILSFVVLFFVVARIVLILLFIPLPQNIFFADITKIDLLNLLNQGRQNMGLSTLTENNSLDEAAALKAKDMIEKGYFAHVSPDGLDPWFWFKEANYNYKYAGENLAIGFIDSKDVYNAWFNSPSHRANILNPQYNEVGVAVVPGFGENNTTLVVQVFAKPLELAIMQNTKTNLTITSNQDIVSEEKVTENDNESGQPTEENTNQESNAATNTSTTEKVLSQTSEYAIAKDSGDSKNNIYLKTLNFIIYDSENALRYVAYAVLLMICMSLAFSTITIMKAGQMPQLRLILRPAIALAIILTSILITNSILIQAIPHTVAI